jgi:hypothetical protein
MRQGHKRVLSTCRRRVVPVSCRAFSSTNRYPGTRFPKDVIAYAVWLYHRFPINLRGLQEILFERDMVVSHESLRQWSSKFSPEYAAKLRRREPKHGDRTPDSFVSAKGIHKELGAIQSLHRRKRQHKS